MEERYKQINELITSVALGNPYISREQIARARSLYSGDERPLEEIEKELLAYSEEIRSRKENVGHISPNKEINIVEEPPLPIELPPQEESYPSIKEVSAPNLLTQESETKEEEIDTMFDEYDSASEKQLYTKENEFVYDNSQHENEIAKETNQTTFVNEKPKQMIKQGNANLSGDIGGYGSVTAILTIATMISIITIIMAVFTITAS